MFFYYAILCYRMLIFNSHCQLVLRISGITKVCYIITRPKAKFSLYLKKAGLASRNIVHLQKNHHTLCRFLLLYSKPEPAIWSRTGQRIDCCDNYQLTITWILSYFSRYWDGNGRADGRTYVVR